MRQPSPNVPAVVVSLVLSFLAAPAFAVYKCEASGSTLYSDLPCPGGSKLDTAAGVTATDVAEAKERAARQKALAVQIDRERAKEDAARAKQAKLAAREAQAKKSKCATLAQRVKWAEEDASAASGRSVAKATTKARRSAEQFEAQCGK